MPKRFIDTDAHKTELRRLDLKTRFTVDWLWRNCDCAGVWQTDQELFRFEAGFTLNLEVLLKSCPWVKRLPNGNVFLPEFVQVNYGELKPGYNPHKPVFRSLEANGIQPLTLQFEPLTKTCPSLEGEEEGEDNSEKKGREVKEHDATFKAQCAEVASEHPEPPPPPPPHPAELAWPSWAGPKCKAKWAEFIAYRIREKKARFKSLDTEQKSLNLCCKYFPTGMMFVEGLEHTMAKNWQSPVDPAEHKYPFSAQAPSTQPSTLKPWVL